MNSFQSRDQMIQNQIRVPQMNFNSNSQMKQMRNPSMNMNQNYRYPTAYSSYAYQSNTDQNNGMPNPQYGYNLMAPQVDYGYTGNNTMMSAAYPGQTNQYQQQSIPSYTQYSFMGY